MKCFLNLSELSLHLLDQDVHPHEAHEDMKWLGDQNPGFWASFPYAQP